ncbi:MAG TPA: substrate-binding domain-containing protein [Pseudomonadota bacterium]|nr:substrate-binding domain-containing protein [Pseudomonadota bacterium]
MRSSLFPRILCLLGLLCPFAGTASAQNVIEGRADSISLRAFGTESVRLFQASEQRRVRLSALSTVSAIEAVARGEAEIALTARGPHALKADETSLDFHAVAWEALALVTHPGNPTPSLSLRQIRDIYLGKITRWDQVGGPPRPINLYAVAGPLDGAEYGLRRALFGAGHRPVAATRWYLNTEQLEAAIAIDPNALGVSALSNVYANRKLRMIRVEGVAAQLDAIRSGEYLLTTPLYFVHRGDLIPSEVAMRYVRFLEAPATEAWLKKRQLLPIREARLLNQTFAVRERRLLELLKKEPAPAANDAVTAPLPDATPAAVTPQSPGAGA